MSAWRGEARKTSIPKRARSYPSYVRDYYGYGYGRYTSKGRASENGHKGTTIDLEQQKNLWK